MSEELGSLKFIKNLLHTDWLKDGGRIPLRSGQITDVFCSWRTMPAKQLSQK